MKKLTLVLFTAALTGGVLLVSADEGETRQAMKQETQAATYSKPADDVLRRQLDPMQYDVTQKEGTEPPFKNAYWDNHEQGIYVDVVTGEPLFSSTDKFDSGTGWPSFTGPVDPEHVTQRRDSSHGMVRTEIACARCDAHLGHVFPDGPRPAGQRYCLNSAAMGFVPAE
jgi:peptide methionine sulfoxide reductase msrA/msrB